MEEDVDRKLDQAEDAVEAENYSDDPLDRPARANGLLLMKKRQ